MKEIVRVDIMLNDMFIHTIKYSHEADCPIDECRLIEYVEDRLPTLKGKDFKLFIQNHTREYEPRTKN